MRKILWYVSLLIPAVVTSCGLEDDSGLVPKENSKLTISFSVQDPASGLATRAAIAAGSRRREHKDTRFDFLRIKQQRYRHLQRLERTDPGVRYSLGDEHRHRVRLFRYRTENDRRL